jgi:hypothetical protein
MSSKESGCNYRRKEVCPYLMVSQDHFRKIRSNLSRIPYLQLLRLDFAGK